jgi:single-strand DNA-binding protein
MLNHIVLMGRLTRDPELRRTGSGVPVASFTVAVDRDFGSREGGEKETDFIDIVAWRNTAEFVSKYFTKGRMAVVSGRLQIRNWNDKDGNKRRSAEVVADNVYFGDSKREGAGGFEPSFAQPAYAQPAYAAPSYNQQPAYGYQNSPAANVPASDFSMLEDDDQLPF